MKICSRCKKHKPLSDFWKNKTTKDGFQMYCKPCVSAYNYSYSKLYRRLQPRTEEIRRQIEKRYEPIGRLRRMLDQARTRIREAKKGARPHYQSLDCTLTIEQLSQIAGRDGYLKQFAEWKKSKFNQRHVPTIDRIDAAIGYTVANVRIVPMWLNSATRARRPLAKWDIKPQRWAR